MQSPNLSIALAIWLLLIAGTSHAQTLLYNPTTHALIEPGADEFFAANPADALVFEGPTTDAFQISLSITDPTADRVITFPDADLNLAIDGSGTFAARGAANTYTADQTLTTTGSTATLTVQRSGGVTTELQAGNTEGTIGTQTNHTFNFRTNDINRLVIKNTGEVEIESGQLEVPGLTYLRANPTFGVTNEQLRLGRSDTDLRYHSIHSGGHNATAADNLLSFRVHDGTTTTSQAEVLRLTGDGVTRALGAVVMDPVTVNLTADDQTITAAAETSTLLLTSDNATATNRTALLANGTAPGQRLLIIWNDTDAGEITDAGNTNLSATWTPGQNDTLHLTWTGSTWLETSRSNN